MNWLVLSVLLSIGLTVILNLAVRASPQGPRRLQARTEEWLASRADTDAPRVRVFFPWRAMLVASVVLTVLVNVIAALTR